MMTRLLAGQPPDLQEPDVGELLEGLFEEGPADPSILFAGEPHGAILRTRNGRRAFDVLPLKPAVRAEVQVPDTRISCSLLTPDASPLIGIDAEWVHVGGNTNRILSYQFAAISGGRAWRGIVTCEDGLRLKLGELVGHALELGVRVGHLSAWPAHVIISAHHSTAEISAFADFAEIKDKFDGVRKTFATARHACPVGYTDRNRKHHDFTVALIDTQHLTPGGKKLAVLGRLYDFPKIELPPGAIEHMDVLQRDDPELFEQYAIRDAEISAYHVHRMREFCQEVLGEYKAPLTLGSIGVELLFDLWEKVGIDHHSVLGTTIRPKSKFYDRKHHRYVSLKPKTVLTNSRDIYELHVTNCYRGGRNEAFLFGVTEPDVWTDFDIKGAYTTAMAAIHTPAYDRAYVTKDPLQFIPDCLGFARVRFQFPEDTRFPCLPVLSADEHGLVFPLEGETHVAAPEIALALDMGAEIEIPHGVIVPWADDTRPFEAFVKDTQSRRGSEKGTFDDMMWKEIGNSLYGKMAQGLRPKTSFNPRSGTSKEVPRSLITNPYIAAHITSLIRAVLGEILHRITADRTVVSVATDGLLTNAAPEKIDTSGPLCSLFADVRERLSGNREILEVKHKVKRVLCAKTRAQITVEEIDREKPILAKGGIFIPNGVEDHNEFMLRLFRDRTHETMLSVKMLTSLREIYTEECDLVSNSQDRRVNLDPDFKRELVSPQERDGLLFCETLPWRTVEEFNAVRAQFEEWRRNSVLKTLDDWRAWSEYRDGAHASQRGVRRSKRGVVDQARRTFLRAYTRRMWGLPGGDYRSVAAWLTAAGYPTTEDDLKNQKRAKDPVERAIPADARGVVAFVRTVLDRFPKFEWHRLVNGKVRGFPEMPQATPLKNRQVRVADAKDANAEPLSRTPHKFEMADMRALLNGPRSEVAAALSGDECELSEP